MREKKIQSIAGVVDVVFYFLNSRPLPYSAADSVDWYECTMAFRDDIPDHKAFINDLLGQYNKSYLTLLKSKKVGPIDDVLGHSGFRGQFDERGVAFALIKTVKKGVPPIWMFDLSSFRTQSK